MFSNIDLQVSMNCRGKKIVELALLKQKNTQTYQKSNENIEKGKRLNFHIVKKILVRYL